MVLFLALDGVQMYYDDSNRGRIQNKERARQIIDFSGLRYGNITPTDIDGLIEYRDRAMIYIEMKHGDADVPHGQRLALERNVNNNRTAGKKAVLFICEHYVDDPMQDINAAETIVREIYYNGEYTYPHGYTLKQLTDRFIDMVKNELPY